MDNPFYFLGHEIQETDAPCPNPFRPTYFRNNDTGSMLELRIDDGEYPNCLRRVPRDSLPLKGTPIVHQRFTSWPTHISELQTHGDIIVLESLLRSEYPELGRTLADFRFLKMPFDFLEGCRFGRVHVTFEGPWAKLYWNQKEVVAHQSICYQEALLLVEDFCIDVWDSRGLAEDLRPIFGGKPPDGPTWHERIS